MTVPILFWIGIVASAFWIGIVASAVFLISSFTGKEDAKTGVIAFPSMMFLAAAVASYIGL